MEIEPGIHEMENNCRFSSQPSSREFGKLCGRPEFTKYNDPASITPPATLDELVSELKDIFSYDNINVEYVQTLMTSYKSNPREWRKYAKFDKHRYTRNLVDEGNDRFNLMIICWNTAQGSSIHDHADAHCFMKVLDGDVQEEQFEWPTEESEEIEMKPKGKNLYKKNEVAYICDEIGLHRVENPSHSNEAVTLHLYSPPFSSCHSFDQRTGHKQKVQTTFWSKFGKRTPFGRDPATMETAENN